MKNISKSQLSGLSTLLISMVAINLIEKGLFDFLAGVALAIGLSLTLKFIPFKKS